MTIIATLPPYVEHRAAIIAHPCVADLRFNSISPLGEPKDDLLRRLRRECGDKRLWIDLKGRQLRITRFAYLPYAYVEINHQIEVDVPAELWFGDGSARIDAVVDGCKLILSRRPWRVLGDGEPVNILHPSLRILDPLNQRDCEFVEAAARLGLHDYMLSFVEGEDDVDALLAIDPEARIVAKIESQAGLAFARSGQRRPDVRLMAARDDLYIHMGAEKTAMLPALRDIIAADSEAIVASKVLESLMDHDTVRLADLTDLELMRQMGYRTFMLGDGICFREEPFQRAMTVFAQWLRD